MARRFYIQFQGVCWSLSKQSYYQLLSDGAIPEASLLDISTYQPRQIKKTPVSAQPIDITDFEVEHYREELEYFLKTDSQTGFNAADYVNIFFD